MVSVLQPLILLSRGRGRGRGRGIDAGKDGGKGRGSGIVSTYEGDEEHRRVNAAR
jgi:hypothetical protein